MTKFLTLAVLVSFLVGGCAFLDSQFVPTYDDQGNEISRTPSELVQTTADAVPYGNVALNFILLAFAGVAKFKQHKTQKGLVATVSAIKTASQDPDLKEAVQKVKDAYLNPAQKSAGVLDLIKLVIAKV